MRAVTISEPGGPEVLGWGEVPDPVCGPGEVLVDVAAAAVNRADLLQRQGHYPPPPGASEILGPGVQRRGRRGRRRRDRLVGRRRGVRAAVRRRVRRAGRRAGRAAAARPGRRGAGHRRRRCPRSPARSGPTSSCWPGCGRGDVPGARRRQRHRHDGDPARHGAGRPGGRHRRQRREARRLPRAGRRRSRSTTATRTSSRWCARATDGHGADVILDIMGAKYLARERRGARHRRPAGGASACRAARRPSWTSGKLMRKRAWVAATTLRSRPATGPGGKAEIVTAVRHDVWPDVERGVVRPIVRPPVPMSRAAEAHAAGRGVSRQDRCNSGAASPAARCANGTGRTSCKVPLGRAEAGRGEERWAAGSERVSASAARAGDDGSTVVGPGGVVRQAEPDRTAGLAAPIASKARGSRSRRRTRRPPAGQVTGHRAAGADPREVNDTVGIRRSGEPSTLTCGVARRSSTRSGQQRRLVAPPRRPSSRQPPRRVPVIGSSSLARWSIDGDQPGQQLGYGGAPSSKRSGTRSGVERAVVRPQPSSSGGKGEHQHRACGPPQL